MKNLYLNIHRYVIFKYEKIIKSYKIFQIVHIIVKKRPLVYNNI